MNVSVCPRTGLSLRSPVITASGTFGYGVEAGHLDLTGLGAIICKGTTMEPRHGNTPVRLHPTAAGMLNAIGLQNVGIDGVIRDKTPLWTRLGVPVLVNISGSTLDEYVHMASRLDGVPGVAGIELNISCPNVRAGGIAFGTTPEAAAEITDLVRRATTLPLLVKLSPNVADIRPIATAVESAGADAISLINTVRGMSIDIRRRQPVLSSVSGGLSGPAIKPLALYLVYQVAATVAIPVVGAGGITTAEDALEFMMAGASAVQMGTALLANPTAWKCVVQDLEIWLRQHEVRDLRDVIGAANPHYVGVKRGTGEKLAGPV